MGVFSFNPRAASLFRAADSVRLFSGTASTGASPTGLEHGRHAPRGVNDLTLPAEKKAGRKAGRVSPGKTSHIAAERGKRAPSGEIGSALRSVYDGALNEDIPPEMLDLLGKLG